MSDTALLARTDAAAFARVLIGFVNDPDLRGRAETLESCLTERFSALYSEVPAERRRVVQTIISESGSSAPDEIDLLRQVTIGFVAEVSESRRWAAERTAGVCQQLEVGLGRLRALCAEV